MADSDFNVIKPIERLQTIQGLAPASRHQERQQKQSRRPKDEHREETQEKPSEVPTPKPTNNCDGSHIDYRA